MIFLCVLVDLYMGKKIKPTISKNW